MCAGWYVGGVKHSISLLLVVPVLSAACSEWPRSAHIPETTGEVAPDDLGDLVPVEWSAVAETVDAPVPNTSVISLARGEGVVFSGTLMGSGWNDRLPNRVWDSPVCDGDSRSSSLGVDGDWTADVDTIGIEVVETTQLCARVRGPAPETGWDLVLVAVDECVLPDNFVFDGSGPVGVGLGGAEGGWSTEVEAGFYQLVFAAYDPVDPDFAVPYDIALASLEGPADPSAVCPTFPTESR